MALPRIPTLNVAFPRAVGVLVTLGILAVVACSSDPAPGPLKPVGGDSSTTCSATQTSCSGACVDLQADTANCGKCGSACTTPCVAGRCTIPCPSPTVDCGGKCVDVTTDIENCGKCGNGCSLEATCKASTCLCGDVVSLSKQIQPLINSTCAGSQCHTGTTPIMTPGSTHASLVNAPASCGGRTLVVPGQADKSYLMNKLTGKGMCGGAQMPKGLTPTQAQIDIFRLWICNGAPNN